MRSTRRPLPTDDTCLPTRLQREPLKSGEFEGEEGATAVTLATTAADDNAEDGADDANADEEEEEEAEVDDVEDEAEHDKAEVKSQSSVVVSLPQL